MNLFKSLLGLDTQAPGPHKKKQLESRIINHVGPELEKWHTAKFINILVVDDHQKYLDQSIEVLINHYFWAAVTIYVASTFKAARAFFEEKNIKLVIMDNDLEDPDGDGASLVRLFRLKDNVVPILANSGISRYNQLLMEQGATDIIGKEGQALKRWLYKNDRKPT